MRLAAFPTRCCCRRRCFVLTANVHCGLMQDLPDAKKSKMTMSEDGEGIGQLRQARRWARLPAARESCPLQHCCGGHGSCLCSLSYRS